MMRNMKVFLPVACFALVLYGLFIYLTDYEKNLCDMTYMFEYPEYIKIPLNYNVTRKFPRYNLYVYGEGRYAQNLRDLKISGIPVLFIPGNAGSHRQARSIASVALRMGHSLRTPYHFNIFAIDFREELSGLYGGVLEEQTEFVQECISIIQNLYSSRRRLILIGHSMGGAISRAVFLNSKFSFRNVSLIYTLATPHKAPVIPFDIALSTFYEKIITAWRSAKKSGLQYIPLISVGGGERDFIVRSELTTLGISHNHYHHEYHVIATAVPGVWLSTDHLAIVWCKQLVLAITRSMFDVVDEKTHEVSENLTYIQTVLGHHFTQRSHGGHFPKVPFLSSWKFSASGQWIKQDETSWRFSRNKVFSTVYILMPFRDDENIIIISSGLAKVDWVFACNMDSINSSKQCSDGTNLSNLGSVIPAKSKTVERRMIKIISSDMIMQGFSHVVVYISATNSQVDVLGERYKFTEREKHFTLPSVPERLITFSPVRILNFPLADHAVFYNLSFTGLAQVTESASLILETRICRAGSMVGQGIIKVYIPWSHDEQYYHIRTSLGGTTVVPVKPHFLPSDTSSHDVHLHMILDPECSYVLFATFPISNMLSQFVKFYGLHVPGYVIALFLSILSGQLYSIGAKGVCPPALYILGKFPTFLSLVILPVILYYVIWVVGFASKFLPEPDNILSGEKSFFSFFMLRSVIYVVSYGMAATFSFLCEKSVSALSRSWIWIRRKTILQVTEKSLSEIPNKQFQVSLINLIICAMLEALTVGIAGSVALLLGLMFYFSKLLGKCIKCKAEEERRGISTATSKWHFMLTLTILWMFSTLFTLPGVITWCKQMPFSLRLVSDPYTFPCATLFLATTVLWQLPIPCCGRLYYRTASHVMHFIAVLSCLYGVRSLYRLLYFICFAFIIVSVHQVISFFTRVDQRKAD